MRQNSCTERVNKSHLVAPQRVRNEKEARPSLSTGLRGLRAPASLPKARSPQAGGVPGMGQAFPRAPLVLASPRVSPGAGGSRKRTDQPNRSPAAQDGAWPSPQEQQQEDSDWMDSCSGPAVAFRQFHLTYKAQHAMSRVQVRRQAQLGKGEAGIQDRPPTSHTAGRPPGAVQGQPQHPLCAAWPLTSCATNAGPAPS